MTHTNLLRCKKHGIYPEFNTSIQFFECPICRHENDSGLKEAIDSWNSMQVEPNVSGWSLIGTGDPSIRAYGIDMGGGRSEEKDKK